MLLMLLKNDANRDIEKNLWQLGNESFEEGNNFMFFNNISQVELSNEPGNLPTTWLLSASNSYEKWSWHFFYILLPFTIGTVENFQIIIRTTLNLFHFFFHFKKRSNELYENCEMIVSAMSNIYQFLSLNKMRQTPFLV